MFAGKLFSGDPRTALVKKNVAGSLLIRAWSCLVQLWLVPATLHCLTPYEYGIWLTVNSLLLWIDQFDIGLGNGLRNKLAEALARDDRDKARRLVSTTFAMLTLIIVPVVLVSAALLLHGDIYGFLNVAPQKVTDLREVCVLTTALVGATFVFKFIGNVYLGLQLPAVSNLLVSAGQTLSLLFLLVASRFGELSLLDVACVYTASPLLAYLAAYPITFTKYRYLRPSPRLFDRSLLPSLFSLGVKFFLVQVAGLVIFASANILISRMLSPAEVTPYQVCYKYFNQSLTLFTLIVAPLWSATTDAYAKADWPWIRRAERKLRKVLAAFLALLVAMVAVSAPVYGWWVGSGVRISPLLSALTAAYMCVLIYSTCYSSLLFGIGKIKLITLATLAEAIAYIPLATWLGGRFGLYGIVGSLLLVNLPCAACNHIQFRKLSSGHARGIWTR